MDKVRTRADAGVKVLGVCNGFQILIEAGLLPGALMRNMSLKFVCREVKLEVTNADTAFTRGYTPGPGHPLPRRPSRWQLFRRCRNHRPPRRQWPGRLPLRRRHQPNGSINDIAGILNDRKNVLGLMPHPENLIEAAHGGTDGRALFSGLLDQVA